MINLRGELLDTQRVVTAVDTSDLGRARELAQVAAHSGASIIKEGLEVSSAPGSSWGALSQVAAEAGLDWVADTKADDISNTIAGFMSNVLALDHPPVAITMHTHAGFDSMRAAQELAEEKGVVMLGVTELTSIKEGELRRQLDFVLAKLGLDPIPFMTEGVRKAMVHMRANEAALAGLGGLVASAKELADPIKSDPNIAGKFTMIPGTRSPGVDANDQSNVETPEFAIANGADLLVIGREITGSPDPEAAFKNVVLGIRRGLEARTA